MLIDAQIILSLASGSLLTLALEFFRHDKNHWWLFTFLYKKMFQAYLAHFLSQIKKRIFFQEALVTFSGKLFLETTVWTLGVLTAIVLAIIRTPFQLIEMGNVCMWVFQRLIISWVYTSTSSSNSGLQGFYST